MTKRRIKKAIMAEVRRLHSHSNTFPVRAFLLDGQTGRCTGVQYEGVYAMLNELMQLCGQLSEGEPR